MKSGLVFRIRTVFAAVGFLLGAFLGLSTGIAIGGEATKGWWFFALLFALIGWVVSAPVMDFVARRFGSRGDGE